MGWGERWEEMGGGIDGLGELLGCMFGGDGELIG